MINWIKYRIELNLAKHELAKCHRPYDKELKQLRRSGNKNKLRELWSERQGVCQIDEVNIEFVITKYLRNRANELGIPLPDYNDENHWQNDFGPSYYLTDKGKYEINKKIRQEMKERREPFIQILALIIGLLGALTGLVSILK